MTNELNEEIHDWDEPVSFEAYKVPVFPTQILPKVLQDMVNAVADATQTPVDASSLAILSMVSAAVARKFEIHLTKGLGWIEQNNLYTVIAMRSGEGKSAIFSHLIKPIIEYEREIQERMSAAQDANPTPRRVARFLADDVTSTRLAELLAENHERMAIMSTEGGLFESLSHRHYGRPPNLDVYLKGFSWDSLDIDRAKSAPISLRKPALTMCLFVQPALLQGLAARLTGRGLLGRFLYTYPASMWGKQSTELKTVPNEVNAAYHDVMKRMLRFDPATPLKLYLTEEALEFFQDFRRGFQARLNADMELAHDFLRTWVIRLPGQLLRIAAAFHVTQWAVDHPLSTEIDSMISADSIVRAIDLNEYLIEHAKAAFGCFKSNASIEDAKYMLDVLVRKKIYIYKRQELWAATKGKFHTSETFDGALEVLKERGYIKIENIKAPKGRCGTRINVNTRLFA